MKKALILLVYLSPLFSFGTIFSQQEPPETKNTLYLGLGRQSLVYIKYERLIWYHKWTQTVFNLGYGGVPGDQDLAYQVHRHDIVTPELAQLFGYRNIFLEIGIEPAITFYGSVTYTDLNGVFGLRYQSEIRKAKSLFFQLGYNPRIYTTYKSDISVPFYLGFGANF